jgi:hypothetical protein
VQKSSLLKSWKAAQIVETAQLVQVILFHISISILPLAQLFKLSQTGQTNQTVFVQAELEPALSIVKKKEPALSNLSPCSSLASPTLSPEQKPVSPKQNYRVHNLFP